MITICYKLFSNQHKKRIFYVFINNINSLCRFFGLFLVLSLTHIYKTPSKKSPYNKGVFYIYICIYIYIFNYINYCNNKNFFGTQDFSLISANSGNILKCNVFSAVRRKRPKIKKIALKNGQ
jgi:hypothetical protein